MKKDGVKRRKRERSDHLMQHRLTSKKNGARYPINHGTGKATRGKATGKPPVVMIPISKSKLSFLFRDRLLGNQEQTMTDDRLR